MPPFIVGAYRTSSGLHFVKYTYIMRVVSKVLAESALLPPAPRPPERRSRISGQDEFYTLHTLMRFNTVYKLLFCTFQCQVDHSKCTKMKIKNTHHMIKSSTMHIWNVCCASTNVGFLVQTNHFCFIHIFYVKNKNSPGELHYFF